mgnify:CR=1 FL=1
MTWYEEGYFGMHNTVTYEGDGQVCVTGNSRTIGHVSLDHVFCGSSSSCNINQQKLLISIMSYNNRTNIVQ